jgi:hypothetical protein
MMGSIDVSLQVLQKISYCGVQTRRLVAVRRMSACIEYKLLGSSMSLGQRLNTGGGTLFIA